MPSPKRYRKKSVEVEAVQWTGENREEVEALTGGKGTVSGPSFLLPTGTADVGDYIVHSQYGTFFPCPNEEFHATYEPVEEGEFEHCKRCGRGNAVWSAPSPLWNAVMRGGSIDGEPKYGDLVCASCFMQLAEENGIASYFRVSAQRVNVELETVTPSGRVWDDERQLWTDLPTPEPTEEGEPHV